MSETLGTIKGQMILDVKQALAAYTAARAAHVSTVTALQTGAGALNSVSMGIAAVGIGIGAGLMVAVNAAGEFERKLDYFSAVSNATQAEYDAIREKALELGKDTIYSAGQIADSFVELGKAGVGARDIINGIGEGVANLGAAADIPLDTASNILMSAVQTFGLGADQAVGVADKLAGAANASIIDVQDLGVSMKYAGGVAAGLGISFDDVNTALALLGNYGVKGSTAGTSLRRVMISLAGATPKATGTLKELGIITEDGGNKFFTAEGKAKSLAEVFQILQEATANLNDKQKLDAFKDVFQTRSLPTVVALTKEGASGFADMYEEIGKTTAMDVANERLDNLSGDIEILRGNIETLLIDSGSKLQEFARGVVQGLTDVIQAFSNLPDGVQEGILKFLALSAVILTVVGFIGAMSGAVLNIIALFLRLAPVLKFLKSAIETVRIAVMLMNTAWLANPVVLIIAAVVALIAAFVLLWKNNEGFRNFWIQLWEKIKTAASNVVEWFKKLPESFAALWALIKMKTEAVWNNIIGFFKSIPGLLMEAFYNFTLLGFLIKHWDAISNATKRVWDGIVNWFRELPGRIAGFFSELPGKLGYIIGFAVGSAVRWFIDMYNQVSTWVANTITSVLNWFAQLPARTVAFIISMYTGITTWFQQLLVDIGLKAIEIYNAVVLWFQQLPTKAAEFFSDLYNRAVLWFGTLVIDTRAKAEEIYQSVVTWFQQLPERVATFFSDMYNKAVLWLGNTVLDVKAKATEIYNSLVDGIKGIPGKVTEIFTKVVDAVKGQITKAFNAVKDFASGMWEGFKDGLGIHSPSYIEHAMWAITGVVGDETQKLRGQVKTLQGLGNGISAMGENMGFGLDMGPDLKSFASQVAQAKQYQDQLTGLAATTTMASSVGVTSTQAITLDSIDKTLQLLATRPQKVVNQDVTNVNPIAERDSLSNDRALQLASAID